VLEMATFSGHVCIRRQRKEDSWDGSNLGLGMFKTIRLGKAVKICFEGTKGRCWDLLLNETVEQRNGSKRGPAEPCVFCSTSLNMQWIKTT
jgi:hypothetical protein